MKRAMLRGATPDDYDALPRLFLDLFYRTSLIIDGDNGPDAFLVGILSPSDPRRAYVHFVGVSPAVRGKAYGRRLYEEFFQIARSQGRSSVSAITAVANTGSVAFHRALGFTVAGPVENYNGPGREMLVFERTL
jgi:ribosomal protein S18 acetylase RimI-like enzyme